MRRWTPTWEHSTSSRSFRESRARLDTHPVCAVDLSGLPPALIVTGEEDNLRVEGERYADLLRQAGVFVNAYCQRGAGHLSALYARANAEAREALDLSVIALRAALQIENGLDG